MKITVEQLQALEAREDHVKIFASEWPDGVDVTRENCLRVAELGLNTHWMAQKLLAAPLQAEYYRQVATLRKEYVRQCAIVFADVSEEGKEDNSKSGAKGG